MELGTRLDDRAPSSELRAPTTYARRVGPFSGVMMVIGGIIGSGIFLNPAIVAQRVGTATLTMAVWVLGGVVALLGAFIFGELGARRPHAGGGYVYLRDAFGPLPAFLYAWALLLIMATGAIAAVAVTFANYTIALAGLGPDARLPLAVSAIIILSVVNYLGVRPGTITQNVFTILKLAAIAGLVVAGAVATLNTGLLAAGTRATSPDSGATVLVIGAALVPVLFSYGGWQQTNFVAEEIVDPERNLPRVLVIGVAAVVTVYLLANLTYLHALGAAGLAASTAPAADTMSRLLGPAGRTVISAGIAISTFGFLNLVILVSPRVYQAMAADGLFFPRLARLHPTYRTPTAAIVLQAVWAVLLTVSGTYGELLDYVVFGDWIFFALTAATLFVYRARERAERGNGGPRERAERGARGFRVPGYPITPLVFIAAGAYVVVGSIASNPGNALRGALLLAAGVPVFLFWQRRSARR